MKSGAYDRRFSSCSHSNTCKSSPHCEVHVLGPTLLMLGWEGQRRCPHLLSWIFLVRNLSGFAIAPVQKQPG